MTSFSGISVCQIERFGKMGYFIRNIIKYREYIMYSAKAQLKAEISNSAIGCIWWVLEPTLFMFIYLFVYAVVFRTQTEYIVLIINVGLVYWGFFNRCLVSSIKMVKRNRPMISMIYIPKFVFICSSMIVNFVKMLCAVVPVVGLVIWYKIHVTLKALMIIPVTLMFFVVVFSLCCWLMHIGVYSDDTERIVPVALRMLFFLSGVFYPIDTKFGTDEAHTMLLLNPVATTLTDVRNSLIYGSDCHWYQLGLQTGIAFVLAVIALIVIKKKESQYIKVV